MQQETALQQLGQISTELLAVAPNDKFTNVVSMTHELLKEGKANELYALFAGAYPECFPPIDEEIRKDLSAVVTRSLGNCVDNSLFIAALPASKHAINITVNVHTSTKDFNTLLTKAFADLVEAEGTQPIGIA